LIILPTTTTLSLKNIKFPNNEMTMTGLHKNVVGIGY